MKSYKTQNVAKVQATKLAKKTGVEQIVAQDVDQWYVGTAEEINQHIDTKVAESKKVKAPSEDKTEILDSHHETPLWVVGVLRGKEVWFEKAALTAFSVEEGQLHITASSRYLSRKFKAAA